MVGAGIGGTSTAYFLQDLFGQDALIDVYEAGEIGGRIATVEVDDRHYESGASIFHPRNEYLVNFTEILGELFHHKQTKKFLICFLKMNFE